MGTLIILHHPLNREAANLQETWAWVQDDKQKYGIVTKMVDKADQASPSHFMQEYWNRGEMLIWLAHDIVPTNDMIDSLAKCRYSLCSQAAILLPIHTGLPYPVFNNRVRDAATGSLRWTAINEEWADFFATDLVKFGTEFQATMDVPVVSWQQIDNVMSRQSTVKTHVHWPAVKHNQGSNR